MFTITPEYALHIFPANANWALTSAAEYGRKIDIVEGF
jgi:hypothetical protein